MARMLGRIHAIQYCHKTCYRHLRTGSARHKVKRSVRAKESKVWRKEHCGQDDGYRSS